MTNSYSPLSVALEQRRNDLDRVDSSGGGIYSYGAFVEVDGVGEAVVTLDFPVVFSERPLFTYGSELLPNSPFANNAFPMVSAVVQSWRQNHRYDTGVPYYLGATVLIAVSGSARQMLLVHCSFNGPGLQPTF